MRTVPVGGRPRRRARGREGCDRGGAQPRVSASRLRALLATVRGAIPSGKPLVRKVVRCHTAMRGAVSPGRVSAPQEPSAAAGAETRAGRPRCPRERPNRTLGSRHAKGANEPPLRGRGEGRRRPCAWSSQPGAWVPAAFSLLCPRSPAAGNRWACGQGRQWAQVRVRHTWDQDAAPQAGRGAEGPVRRALWGGRREGKWRQFQPLGGPRRVRLSLADTRHRLPDALRFVRESVLRLTGADGELAQRKKPATNSLPRPFHRGLKLASLVTTLTSKTQCK